MAAPHPHDVLVAQQTPTRRGGQGLRVCTLVDALAAAGSHVTVVFARFGADATDPSLAANPAVTLREVVPSRGARRALTYARRRLAGTPDGWARSISPELVAVATHQATAAKVDRVIADGPAVMTALMGLARRRPVIYNAHNLESAFRAGLDDQRLGSARTLRAAERRLLAAAAETWMVSEPDAAGARELEPGARVRVVPNVVDTGAIAPVDPGPARAGGGDALLVGDFTYAPNRDALAFLLDDVLPRARSLGGGGGGPTLRLVGRGLEDDPVRHAPGVLVRGRVDDLAAEYAAARCALVPLRAGGGTPFKLLEALAYGVPVLATPQAAAALDVRDGEHLRIAEGADAFAAALHELVSGADADAPARAARGRTLVEQRYSVAALTRLLAPEHAAA